MMVISNEPELIMNDINIIYRPKPKKVYKSNFELSPKSNTISNQDSKTHGKKHKNRKKHENLNLNLKKNGMTKSQNFDLISFEEIENDFKMLKAQSERVQVENELLKLLENSTEDTSFDEDDIKRKKIKRSKIPYFSNIK